MGNVEAIAKENLESQWYVTCFVAYVRASQAWANLELKYGDEPVSRY